MSRELSKLIRGGLLLDVRGYRRTDILVDDGCIVLLDPGSSTDRMDFEHLEIIEAQGCIITPAFVDPHTHLRVPGGEEAETLESGSKAGAAGGYCALLSMPNTEPAIDTPARVQWLLQKAQNLPIDILVSATITKARHGKELSPYSALKDAGVHVFTDDGSGVQNPMIMLSALKYTDELGLLLAQHCETESLFNGGIMNDGVVSDQLGIPGIPASAEETMVARDIELARSVGAAIHFLHLSTNRSADLVARAKSDGLRVSAEVTPHHLYLDESKLCQFDARFKVNPPLRAREEVLGLWKHLSQGTFDVIGTDHAPHPNWKKETTLDHGAFGMLGLQHSFLVLFAGIKNAIKNDILPIDLPAAVTESIEAVAEDLTNAWTLAWLWLIVSMMSWRPSRLIGYPPGTSGLLSSGSKATFVIFDPNDSTLVSTKGIYSKANNSPYLGETFDGKVRDLFVKGTQIVRDGLIVEDGNWC